MQSRGIHDDGPSRLRSDSGTSRLRPGISDAVNTATEDTDVDARLVAKITEHVLDKLKIQGIQVQNTPQLDPVAPPADLNGTQNVPISHSFPIPLKPPGPQSRTTSPASSHSIFPTRFTPPSPARRDHARDESSSPDPDVASRTSREPRASTRRDSSPSMSGQDDTAASRSRPRPVRIPSSIDETAIEKAWRPLFDDGKPTPRLRQFLRGLAKHIIDDFKPQHSTVITPGKLADFFNAARLPIEMYPWYFVFGGGKVTNVSISRVFRELKCQHHLVQRNDHDAPTIPGLTPQGFETFIILLIQAYPDQEYQRLDKAARKMPVSNPDNPSERFPKELSRRLFPTMGDAHVQQRLTDALSHDPVIAAAQDGTLPGPPPAPPSANGNASVDRERIANYASPTVSAVDDDDDLRVPPFSIERERKPYIAKEGSGKIHEDTRPPASASKPDATTRPARTSTVGSANAPFQSSRPIDMSSSAPRAHRMSMNGTPRPREDTSSSMQPPYGSYTRSDGSSINEISSSHQASNMGGIDEQQPRRGTRGQIPDEERSFRAHIGAMAPSVYEQNPNRGQPATDGHSSFAPPPPQAYPRYN